MPRIRLDIAYDGTLFHGWQSQEPPGVEPLRTVQGVLQETISRVMGEPVQLVGASRTDAGVHARGQVAAFTTTSPIPPDRMAMAITSRLPPDVQVIRASVVHDDFDPISDCISKCYRYRVQHGPPPEVWPPLFDRHWIYFTWHRLDGARMQRAARHLLGTHDFAAFTRLQHGRESTIRTIHECSVISESSTRLHILVSGSGFLYNMVRIIAGTLVEVGRGRIEPDSIPEILASRERSRAGATLPPEGLCLEWIHYGPPVRMEGESPAP